MIFLSCEIWIKLAWFFVLLKTVYGVAIYLWCEAFILNKGTFLEVESKNLKSNNSASTRLKAFWKTSIAPYIHLRLLHATCFHDYLLKFKESIDIIKQNFNRNFNKTFSVGKAEFHLQLLKNLLFLYYLKIYLNDFKKVS